MTIRDRIRFALERLVIQLWLCAMLMLLFRFSASDAAPAPETPVSAPPAQCDLADMPSPCTPDAQRTLLRLASAPQASYLAACVASPPCRTPFLGAAGVGGTLVQEVERVRGAWGSMPEPVLLRTAPDMMPPDCGQAGPPALFVLPETMLTPSLEVLAGPFDASGNPVPAAGRPPLLTVLPAVSLDAPMERLLRLSERFPGVPDRLAAWSGTAGHGWLVFPLTRFSPDAESYPAAVQLLGRIARAVVPPPRPHPVIVDLAGMSPCPSVDEMQRLVYSLSSLGFFSVGQALDGAPGTAPLFEGQVLRGRVLSVAVTSAEGACPTTASVQPANLGRWLAAQSQDVPPAAVLTVVLLHWKDPDLSASTRESLVQNLLDAGASVVAGVQPGSPGPLLGSTAGLGIANLGTMLSLDGVIPRATGPSGAALQCHRSDSATYACSAIPVAPSLGIGVPVPDPTCAACRLLPSAAIDGLYR
ncbi:MAG: hypothetical protein FJ109_07365 [Deltaproteobacteria bacterium]|nr:hypothetical protein [Deltaproteobacteria bacterium]